MSHTWTHKHKRDNPVPLKTPIKFVQRAKRDQRALSADLRQRYDARQDVPEPEPGGVYRA